jgi:hypothetical protein
MGMHRLAIAALACAALAPSAATQSRGTPTCKDGATPFKGAIGRSANGPWRPCKSFGSADRQAAGGRDVGVWSIKNEARCSAKAAFGDRSEDCVAIPKESAVLAAKQVSGALAASVQGTVAQQ